jgi:hypothetical protein
MMDATQTYNLNTIAVAGGVVMWVLLLFAQSVNSQPTKSYNAFTDTLIILNGKTITEDKILVQREELNIKDTLKVNQRGLVVDGFTFQALALGQSIELQTEGAVLTNEMIKSINNHETKYKFFYLKDIILLTKDGRKVSPTTKTIKIVFIN